MFNIRYHGVIRESMESPTVKTKNEIEHVKDLLKTAAADDKQKLRDTLKLLQDRLKKATGGKIDESIDDEDVHLQSAHDALSSRVSRCKREGKECKELEARLSTISSLLNKKV